MYHTKFPWEAQPAEGIESQQYVFYDPMSKQYRKGNATAWYGEKSQVLYRRSLMGFSDQVEVFRIPVMELADFVVPYGIMRADKMRFPQKPFELTLGAFGFPDNGTEILNMEHHGSRAVVLKGHDHMGNERQLAMTIFAGWDEISLVKSKNTNADSLESIIVYAKLKREKQYGYEPYILISQVITKCSLEDFREDEIFPLKEILYKDKEACGGYGPIRLCMKDGTEKQIDFYGMESKLTI